MRGKVVDRRPRALLLKEIEELRARLAEAEQTLGAIRCGDIDALMIQTPDGEQIYSLTGVERVYRTIVETMNEAALTVSPEGVILFCNQRFAEMVNVALQEVVGSSLADRIEPSHRMLLSELIEKAQSGSSRCRLLLHHPTAAPKPAQFSGSLLVTESGRSICMVVTDLSQIESAQEFIQLLGDQKKKLERSKLALQESEQRFRLALKNSPVLVAMQDSNLVYQWAYNSWTRRPEDIIGKTDSDLFAPEDLHVILEVKSKVLQTGEMVRHEIWLTSNGQRLFLDCYYEPVRDSAGKIIGVGIAAVNLTEQKLAEEELRQLNLSLEQRVSERTSELVHTVEVLQEEIGQRVRVENELKLANEQLVQRADQLRRLAGELTATEQAERKRLSKILHDGLQQHLVSAKMRLGGLSEQIENEGQKQAAEEIEKIIGEGVSMSRSLSAELCPPILHEGGLSQGLDWLIRWMREKHRFSVDLSLGAVPELREDVKMLVFESVRELLFNSLKHAQASKAQVRLDLVGEGALRVTVSDEGAGFDACRLLPAGDGGGFGLFSIRERLDLIGGRLEIDSAPGRGSRVALTVPHGKADAATFLVDCEFTPDVLPPGGATEGHETTIRVLLVDDHALFRNGIARLLKNDPGLEVIGEAKDGIEAIEFTQELKPDVILMDISMPGLNGVEATRVIHEQHPGVCIIGLSMHDDPEKARAMRAAGATDYMTKGCAAAELVAAIRAGLQTRKPSPE